MLDAQTHTHTNHVSFLDNVFFALLAEMTELGKLFHQHDYQAGNKPRGWLEQVLLINHESPTHALFKCLMSTASVCETQTFNVIDNDCL